MKKPAAMKSLAVVVLLVVFFIAQPLLLAEKPPWAGGGKNKAADGENKEKSKGRHGESHKYFTEGQRVTINKYYSGQYTKKKHCPPGLAKKNNGCMPPGQAKKWVVGQPLPHEVVYYPLPSHLVVELGPPPPNTKYVRVAQDILLLGTGTKMVVDAVQDLNWEFKH